MTQKTTQTQLIRQEITLFWFRRDLRLYDNAGLYHALKENKNVLPLFIFDTTILKTLPQDDKRVVFIHKTLSEIKKQLRDLNTDILVEYGNPVEVFKKISERLKIKSVYTNHDYEPQALVRDQQVMSYLKTKSIDFKTYKDQTIFEKDEIKTDAGKPYTVYTPYKKKWLSLVNQFYLKSYPVDLYEMNYLHLKKIDLSQLGFKSELLTLPEIGFQDLNIKFPGASLSKKVLESYSTLRDYPGEEQGTTKLGLHLRFGTVSVRELAREGQKHSDIWLSELIWRDFFMQILWHYPHVEKSSFRPQYENINWRYDLAEFERWKLGQTGYPLVDAGMRELNKTGHMHNRVRMVVASFLTKHLLHHWLHGERYFAEKLLDYDLSANNGNWQWAAGTGCDAAPYFRVFNPESQLEKFDPKFIYVKKWVPEYGTFSQLKPMVDHTFARNRALTEFKKGLS